jgi:RNA polymerase sigma-70 factor (ECF subfamily)
VKDLNTDHFLKDAIAGDADAFGVLYECYINRIYNYVYYRTGNKYDAEDLTERVFFKAMEHINNYQDYGLPFSAWLYRIAHNLVANWHRDNSRRKEIPIDERLVTSNISEHPEKELVHLEEREYLMRVIQNLPEDRQQLIILKFVDHMSNAEIGEVLGRTEGAIKSLYHRTLLSLREEILSREDREYYLIDKVMLDPVSEDHYS